MDGLNSSYVSGFDSNISTYSSSSNDQTLQFICSPKTRKLSKGEDVVKEFFSRAEVEESVRELQEKYQEELHQQRLENIRSTLEAAKKDDWKYNPQDPLLKSHSVL